MTLLISIFAAVVSTVCWYNTHPQKLCLGVLCWMFWGASIMWFVDAIFEYAELGAAYFTPESADMLNDTFLGLTIVALALVIWIVILLITDPKGVVRSTLFNKEKK